MEKVLLLLSRALESFGYRGPSRFIYYRKLIGGKLDGKTIFVGAETGIQKDFYHIYDSGIEETSIDKYTLVDDGTAPDFIKPMEDGRFQCTYLYQYVETQVSDCPLSAPKKPDWEI